MPPAPFRPLFEVLVHWVGQKWITRDDIEHDLWFWRCVDELDPSEEIPSGWRNESHDEMVLQEFWPWGPSFGCWRQVSSGRGDHYVQCFPEWQIFTRDGKANIVPGIRDRDIARLAETIPRELHEPMGHFCSIQWQILDAVLFYPPFQEFLINEIRHVGPGFIAASFLYGKYDERIDSERLDLIKAIMHQKRTSLLTELNGILSVTNAALRVLRLIDVGDWPGGSILGVIELISPHDKASTLVQKVAAHRTEIKTLRDLCDLLFPKPPCPYQPPPIITQYPLVPLISRALVAEEGRYMRHCLSQYIERPAEGRYYYYAWHGEDRATIEIYLTRKLVWVLSGARGPNNAVLSSGTMREIERALGFRNE